MGDVPNEWLEGHSELQRIFALWIRTMVTRHRRHRLLLPKVRDLQELQMTLTDRFDAWAREYERKGIEKGEALLLQRQSVRRFGPLPSDLVAQLGSATAEQLKEQSQETERLLRAQSQATDQQFQATDRKLNPLERLFASQWGKRMESLVEGELVALLTARGIPIPSAPPSAR